jgi:transposase
MLPDPGRLQALCKSTRATTGRGYMIVRTGRASAPPKATPDTCWYILNMTWGTRTYVLENNVSCWSLCPRCQSRIRRLSALTTYHEPACEAVEIPKSHFFLFFLFMQYIGIDVASEKLDICVHDTKQDDPEKKWRHYKIPNTETDLEKWIVSQNFLKKECLFGTESTGKYHRLCQKILVRRGYSFSLINPIATKQMIAGTIRKKKTDISDAKIITQLLIQGIGDGIKEDQLDTTKKTLMRTRKTIVKHTSTLKLLKQELAREEQYQHIAHAIDVLENLIEALSEGSKNIEEEATKEMGTTETEKLIRSLPGFATCLSAVVASEVGDFTRFPSARQFKAYVGIDPKVHESGKYRKLGSITKRGNPHLRCAFYLAAQVARLHDPELKAFFEKKYTEENKDFRVAICAVARKLCERVYATVIRGTPYEIREVGAKEEEKNVLQFS